jgi:hypothetical protein
MKKITFLKKIGFAMAKKAVGGSTEEEHEFVILSNLWSF